MKNGFRITVLTTALLFMSCLQAFNQLPEILWDKTIGGNGNDNMARIYPAADGGWYLFGTTNSQVGFEKSATPLSFFGNDIWVMKYDSNWNKEWDKVYGGYDDDNLGSVLLTADGGFLMAATSLSDKSADKSEDNHRTGYNDIWLCKIDTGGNVLWDKTIGGMDHDNLSSFQYHPWGGYLLGATSWSGMGGDKSYESFGKHDWWLLRISEEGEILWDRVFGGTKFDHMGGIWRDTDGLILTGRSDSPETEAGNKTAPSKGSYDAWLVKIDYDGNIIWDRTYGGDANEGGAGITRAHDGGFVLSINSKSGISGDKTSEKFGAEDAWFVKIDSNWVTQWDKAFGTEHKDYLGAGRVSTGGYLLSGTHLIEEQLPLGGIVPYGERWMILTDDQLNVIWDFKYGADDNETGGPGWVIRSDSTKILLGHGSNSGISGQKTEDSRGGYDYWLTMIQMPFKMITGRKRVEQNIQITIYPNPLSGDRISVRSGKSAIREVTLFTITGKRVYHNSTLNEISVMLSVPNLSDGIYIVSIRTNDGKYVNQKIIKQ